MARKVPGIFCVEGTWSSKLTDRASVLDMLEILEDVDGIDFIHDRVTTVDALFTELRKWRQKQYSHFGLGYFAFHGKPGRILVGRRSVTLKELGKVLAGGCEGKTLYFGSCSVLQVPNRQIEDFRRLAKASCVVGFTREVDWLASAALDLILLQALALGTQPESIEAWLDREYGGLAQHLGLAMYFDGEPDSPTQPQLPAALESLPTERVLTDRPLAHDEPRAAASGTRASRTPRPRRRARPTAPRSRT